MRFDINVPRQSPDPLSLTWTTILPRLGSRVRILRPLQFFNKLINDIGERQRTEQAHSERDGGERLPAGISAAQRMRPSVYKPLLVHWPGITTAADCSIRARDMRWDRSAGD
jgi:hypothetical protein